MIHSKAPHKPKPSIDHKKIHGGYESPPSSRPPQDTKTRGGADLKKKPEKAKSNQVFDSDCSEQSPSKNTSSSSSPIRNHMKPTVTSSLKAVKSSMKKNANRATCSSTLKNSKFPAALELNHGATEAEGTSKIRVCPYARCSLNGHMHGPLPPLKYFISARRNSLKTPRSFQAKRLFSAQTTLLEDEGEMIDDEIGETNSFGYGSVMDQNGEFSQEEMDDGGIKKSEIEAMDMNWEDILNVAAVDYKEIDGIQKRASEEFERVKEFDPRPPNFLPLEPDPEAEKVDLRHQTMDERRNSEEWMMDYALQQAVTELGSGRKKKVAMLVQAFETITPSSLRENCLSHGASTSNHLSFLQACN